MRFPGIVKNMSYIVPESVIAFSIYSNTFVIFGFYGTLISERDDNPKIMIIAKTSRATTTNRLIPVLLSKIPV
jgi:hypothetical protein